MSKTRELFAKHKREDGTMDWDNFVAENDALLSLIEIDEDRKMYAAQTMLPTPQGPVLVWQVRERSRFDKKKNTPIAWFTSIKDVNRFIFSPDLKREFEAEVRRLEQILVDNNLQDRL